MELDVAEAMGKILEFLFDIVFLVDRRRKWLCAGSKDRILGIEVYGFLIE